MECTIIIEGNAYEKGNKSSLWLMPGLHEGRIDPQSQIGCVKILGPCDHSLTLETADRLSKFFLVGGSAVRRLETTDD